MLPGQRVHGIPGVRRKHQRQQSNKAFMCLIRFDFAALPLHSVKHTVILVFFFQKEHTVEH